MLRVSNFLNRICRVILVLTLIAMTVATFLQVLFRYVIHLPLFWTEEFARYCLIWSSLMGAGVAMKRGQHIAVTILVERLPAGLRRVSSLIATLSILLLLAVMLWGGIELVIVTRFQISPALRIPMAIPYSAIPIGSAIMLVHALNFLANPPPSAVGRKDLD